MLRIGLTGGIGSGKSTVAQIFEVLGIPVFYADAETKKLMNGDPDLKYQIIKYFGDKAYKEGILDRAYLASLVFHDKEKLELLNSLTHPAVSKQADDWMQRQTTPYALHEAALIFEAGVYKRLNYVIGVSAPTEMRINRTMERDKITCDEVLKRMERQMDESEKMKRCDFIIINDEQQLVTPQVLALHLQLFSASVI